MQLLARMPRGAVIVLVALLLIDIILIGLHMWQGGIAGIPVPVPDQVESRMLNLETDGGFAEWLNYLVLSIAAGVLALMARRDRAPVLAAWAFLLAVAVADDVLSLHENWGEALSAGLELPAASGLRARDLGELLVWAGMGAILLPVLVLTHRASDQRARTISWRLTALLGALAFFAVAVDMLHIAWEAAKYKLAVIEDGGEVVVCSLILVAVIAAAIERGSGASIEGDRLEAAGLSE